MKGFTVIEVIIVIVLLVVIGVILAPVSFNYFRIQRFNDVVDNVVASLRKAHNQALFQKSDSDFGVKFLSDNYVVFKGISYSERDADKDERFVVPVGVSISGLEEIIFQKLTGLSSASGTVNISAGVLNAVIEINYYGKIELE